MDSQERRMTPAAAARVLPATVVGVVVTCLIADAASAQPRRTSASTRRERAGDSAERRAAPSTPVTPAMARTAPSMAAAVSAALAEYRNTGVARPVAFGMVVVLPFGHVEPVVTCSVLRACVVELEPGEQIADTPVAGDPIRWSVDGSKAGPGGETALVLVKPRACDVTTNLVVPTDRRIYDLTLDSPPCPRGSLNPRMTGVRHVRFYYPDDVRVEASSVVTPLVGLPSAGRPVDPRPADALSTIEAEAVRGGRGVNRAYRVVRERRGPFGLFGRKRVDFPWQPAGIADDGARTFVALPVKAAPHAAPVLYAIEDDGSRTMVNYAVRTVAGVPVYVADRVVKRAVLVVMAGSRERKLEIENRGWGRAVAMTGEVGVRPPARRETSRREARGG
jgi:type IV secretion system protein VirB9